MFDRAGFREFFFASVGTSQNTLNTYNSYLGRIDQIVDGLDERIAADGGEALLQWALTTAEEPLASHRSQARSILRTYIKFHSGQFNDALVDSDGTTPQEAAASVFKYERELQAAVRAQIASLEDGLSIDDGGIEATFETGKSDILARDKNGDAVVVELKAGPCPKGTFEQVLGYAQSWAEEGEAKVRCIVVAGSFSERQRAAAKRIPDLILKEYRLAVQFADV